MTDCISALSPGSLQRTFSKSFKSSSETLARPSRYALALRSETECLYLLSEGTMPFLASSLRMRDMSLRMFDGTATSRCYFGVQFYLEDLLGCPVDLVTEKALRPELRPYIERERVDV